MHDWTILLYLAGDNGRVFKTADGNLVRALSAMTGAALADLAEAQQVGTTERIAMLAQLDTLKPLPGCPQGTYRLEIRQSATPADDIVEVIPEANTGDPAELARFIVWGMQRCPATRTMLVLWNHGVGWKDTDLYKRVRAESRSAAEGEEERAKNMAPFVTTLLWADRLAQASGDAATRAILYDDTSLDFLGNVEMSQALRVAQVAETPDDVTAIFADPARLQAAMHGTTAARRRLSLLGMDACLMAMIEVQYQVRACAEVMVASQEVVPMQGWPYATILEQLNANPAMTPQALARLIVQEYAASIQDRPVTLSSVDLASTREVQRQIARMAAALNEAYPYDSVLRSAWARAAGELRGVFRDRDYVDLAEFVARLHAYYYDGAGVDAAVLESSASLRDWLRSDAGPVLACAATGKYKDANVSGITVYVPRCHADAAGGDQPKLPPSPAYQELDFASSGWLELLQTVYETH